MRTQYQQREGRSGTGPERHARATGRVDLNRGARRLFSAREQIAARLYDQLGARLPPRFVAPFLLFWCLGSLVLGHELASLPLGSFASAVTRQAVVQVQGVFPRANSPASNGSAHLTGASSQVLPAQATGVLGRKIPVVHKPVVKTTARKPALAVRRSTRDRTRSSPYTDLTPMDGNYGAFPDAAPWNAFPWGDGAPWDSRSGGESDWMYRAAAQGSCGWMAASAWS